MQMGRVDDKRNRLWDAVSHRQPDRIPVGDAFWTGFVKRCKAAYGSDFDPVRHFDLDWAQVIPNMDPKIQEFEVVRQDGEDITVRTGFGATIRRSGEIPMPSFEKFSINQPEEMADFTFDDPADPRRFFQGGDDQINCVGDALSRGIPAWRDRMQPYVGEFPIFGAVCEPYEYVWRIIGTENALYWMLTDAELFEDFIVRIGDFMVGFMSAQIKAAEGRLDGMFIYGDVAYRNGMLFSPELWRRVFKPQVKRLVDVCRDNSLISIYHGCGDGRVIYDDLVEVGIHAYNPLEAKAGLDVVELKKQYAGRLAFCGNIDVRVLESGDAQRIENEVRYKSQAGQGGGFIFHSDHSISSGVAPESYALALKVLRSL